MNMPLPVVVTVQDEFDSPLPGATVQVQVAGVPHIASTDETGRAEFSLDVGTYPFTVMLEGFVPVSSSLEVRDGSRNATVVALEPAVIE